MCLRVSALGLYRIKLSVRMKAPKFQPQFCYEHTPHTASQCQLTFAFSSWMIRWQATSTIKIFRSTKAIILLTIWLAFRWFGICVACADISSPTAVYASSPFMVARCKWENKTEWQTNIIMKIFHSRFWFVRPAWQNAVQWLTILRATKSFVNEFSFELESSDRRYSNTPKK